MFRFFIKIVFLSLFYVPSITLSGIKISASIPDSVAKCGDIIKIPVVVDLGELPEKLGSFTAILTWKPTDINFETYKSSEAGKTSTLLVNTKKVSNGELILALVKPKGLSGKIQILTLDYKILKNKGKILSPKLQIKSIAAAMTYEDLLPFIDEIKSEVVIHIKK